MSLADGGRVVVHKLSRFFIIEVIEVKKEGSPLIQTDQLSASHTTGSCLYACLSVRESVTVPQGPRSTHHLSHTHNSLSQSLRPPLPPNIRSAL